MMYTYTHDSLVCLSLLYTIEESPCTTLSFLKKIIEKKHEKFTPSHVLLVLHRNLHSLLFLYLALRVLWEKRERKGLPALLFCVKENP